MNLKEKETRLVSHTYFQKETRKTIDDVMVGDLVFIKIWSPLYYGSREWIFYGKIAKITKCFFWITEYAEANWTFDTYCNTESISKRNANPTPYTKQWAKSRLMEIWSATTKEKLDEVVVYNPQ